MNILFANIFENKQMNPYLTNLQGKENYSFSSNMNTFSSPETNHLKNHQQLKEEYLQKTIAIKNTNIQELLEEIRSTKVLYQQYKHNYIAEENKFKEKIHILTSQLQNKTAENQKLKINNQKISFELENLKLKQNQIKGMHEDSLKLNDCKFHQIILQKSKLQQNYDRLNQKYTFLQKQYSKLEVSFKNEEKQKRVLEEDVKLLHVQIKEKDENWTVWKSQIIEMLSLLEKKNQQKMKVNHKLGLLEEKIKKNLEKI